MATVGPVAAAGARVDMRWRFASAPDAAHPVPAARAVCVAAVPMFAEALEAEPAQVPTLVVSAELEVAIMRALETYRDRKCGARDLCADARNATVHQAVEDMMCMLFSGVPPTGAGMVALFLAERAEPQLASARRVWWQLLTGRPAEHAGTLMTIAALCLGAHLPATVPGAGPSGGSAPVNPRALLAAAMHALQLHALGRPANVQKPHEELHAVMRWARAQVSRCLGWLGPRRDRDAWGRFAEVLPLLTRLEWDVRRRMPAAMPALDHRVAGADMFFCASDNCVSAIARSAVFYGKFAPLQWLGAVLHRDRVVLAGGSAAAAAGRVDELGRTVGPSSVGWESADLDLFMVGPHEQRDACLARLLAEFACHHPGASVWCDHGIYTIDIRGGARESAPEHMQYAADSVRVQIITTDFSDGCDLVARFDQTYLQWFYDGRALVGTAEAVVARGCGANWYTGAQVGSRAFQARADKAVARGMWRPRPANALGSLRVFSVQYWDDPDSNLEYGAGIPAELLPMTRGECCGKGVCGFHMNAPGNTPLTPLVAVTKMRHAHTTIGRDPVSHTWRENSAEAPDAAFALGTDANFALDLAVVERVEVLRRERYASCARVDVTVPAYVAEKIRACLDRRCHRAMSCAAYLAEERGSVAAGGTTVSLIFMEGNKLEWAAAEDPVPRKVVFPGEGDAFTGEDVLGIRPGDVISVAGHGLMVGERLDACNTKVLVATTGRNHGPRTPYLDAFMAARRRVEE